MGLSLPLADVGTSTWDSLINMSGEYGLCAQV